MSYITELRFYCADDKVRRALANLFKSGCDAIAKPGDEIIRLRFAAFVRKLGKLRPPERVRFDFFRAVVHGANYGPMVTCPRNGPVELTIVHDGEFDIHARALVGFICSLHPAVEALAKAWDTQPWRESWIKKCIGQEIESRSFRFESEDRDLHEWCRAGISFAVDHSLLQIEQARSGRSSLDVAADAAAARSFAGAGTRLVEMLQVHGLLPAPREVEVDTADSAHRELERLLQEHASDRLVLYPEVQGGWVGNQLVDEYADLVRTFVAKSGVCIEDLILELPVDAHGEEDPYGDMTIAFRHGGRRIRWHFNLDSERSYFLRFSRWARSALDGGYIWFSDDYFRGYILPSRLVEALHEIGIEGES